MSCVKVVVVIVVVVPLAAIRFLLLLLLPLLLLHDSLLAIVRVILRLVVAQNTATGHSEASCEEELQAKSEFT